MNGQRSQLWTSDYCRVLLAHLLLLLTGNLLASSFSLYLFFRGGTDMTIGVLHYLNAFGALLMRPFAGWYLDHRSRRSLLMLCLVGLVCLPFGYIFASSMALIALDRLLTSLLSAVATTGVTTNAYDTLNEGNFNEGVGYLGFCNSLANAIGPGLGLWLWEKHNVWGLFGAVAVASLLALLLLRKFNFREIPKEHITPFRQESFRNLLYEKNALPASILEAIIALGSGAISPYLILFLIQRGVMYRPGLFYTFQACGTFISRLFVGKISDRWGEAPLVYSSALFFTLGVSAVSFAESQILVCMGAVLMGFGYGFVVTGFQIMSVRIVPPERRGTAASTYSMGWDVPMAFGGLIAGILNTKYGYDITFRLILLLYPIFVLIYVFVISKHPSAFRNWKRAQEMGRL